MRLLRQTLALIAVGIGSIPERLGSSLVTVIGVTCVVGVLVSLLAMSEGANTFTGDMTGDDSVAVLGRGATTAAQSVLSREAVTVISDTQGLKRTADGKPYLAASTMVGVDVMRRNGKRGSVFLVGFTPGTALVWPDIRMIEGRTYRPGLHELIVPDTIRKMFKGLEVGKRITLRGVEWVIVGVFVSSNSRDNSMLRADAATVMATFGRDTFQEVDVKLESPAIYPAFRQALLRNPNIAVEVKTVAQSLKDSFGDLHQVLDFIAFAIGGVMAAGAICGALNSMYTSVDTRRREIATLRALGFNQWAIILSLLAEGMVLALPGAALGAVIAWLLFNGNVVSSEGLVFRLNVTGHVLLVAVGWALAIGLLGGSLPAWRAIRMRVAAALRPS